MTVKNRFKDAVDLNAEDYMDSMKYNIHEWIELWNNNFEEVRTEVWGYNHGRLFEIINEDFKNGYCALVNKFDTDFMKGKALDLLYASCGYKDRGTRAKLLLTNKEAEKSFYKFKCAYRLLDQFQVAPIFNNGMWQVYSLLSGDVLFKYGRDELRDWAKENDCLFVCEDFKK